MKSFLLTLAMMLSVAAYTQSGNWQIDKINEQYDNLSYQKVIVNAQLLLEKSKKLSAKDSLQILKKLAYACYYTKDYALAEEYFAELILLESEDADVYLKYAQVLASNGKHSLSSDVWQRYSDLNDGSSVAAEFAFLQANTAPLTLNSESYEITYLPINSSNADFSPMYLDSGMVFVSSRQNNSPIKRVFEWDDSPFLDLYFLKDKSELYVSSGAKLSSGSSSPSFGKSSLGADYYTPETANDAPILGYRNTSSFVEKPSVLSDFFSKELNSVYHEGPCQFYDNNRSIIFTGNGVDGFSYESDDGISRIHLYMADRIGSEWENLRAFPYNNANFSTGHPAFMNDESIMFFVSDMPGGYGGTDIYFSKLLNGQWFEPQNAGPIINTANNEMFPYVDEENHFYFASDGHPGLGGLDIFTTSLNKQGIALAKVQNLGAPINSRWDDFGILSSDGFSEGFFSSNRKRGGSDDDIYSFKLLGDQFACKDVILAVKSGDTEERIPNASFTYFNIETPEKIENGILNNNGESDLCLSANSEYYFDFAISGFSPLRKFFSTVGLSDFRPTELLISLNLEKKEIVEESEVIPKVMAREKDLSIPNRYRGEISMGAEGLLSGVRIRFVNKCNGEIQEIVTQDDGRYNFIRDEDCDYEFIAMKPGFATNYEFVAKRNNIVERVLEVATLPTSNAAQESFFDPAIFKVGDVVTLDKIYYDAKDEKLASASKNDLDQLSQALDSYPNMIIEIFSHTDSRGNANDNLLLSQRRADEVKQYLTRQNISPLRIKAVGMGEKSPVNNCGDGIQCTEAEHRRNRRTEFKILQIEKI